MMKRQQIILVFAGIFSLGMGFLIGPNVLRLMNSSSVGVHALWTSSAATIADQAKEADLIVRVEVQSVDETRALIIPIESSEKDVVPFTDANLQILEVYKGAVPVGKTIKVMQTGGSLPETEIHPSMSLMLESDPLFIVGSEHILFLKDISGDAIHASERELYRIINPISRYDIQGDTVLNHADIVERELPTRLDGLLEEIKQATMEE
jgi:hypothetical protein